MSESPSFLRLNNIPLYVYATFLLIHSSINGQGYWFVVVVQWWNREEFRTCYCTRESNKQAVSHLFLKNTPWTCLNLTAVEGVEETPMFIAALFTIAKVWKQPKCPSTYEWIKKMWYIYTMEDHSAIKKNFVIFNNMDGTWGHYAKWNVRKKD